MVTEKAPEVRRNALKALESLALHSLDQGSLTSDDWKPMYKQLLLGLEDYSRDNRGQVHEQDVWQTHMANQK